MVQSLPGPLSPATPQDYERVRLATFDAGVNYAEQPEKLSENALGDALNLRFYQGQLLVDTGYGPFGPQISGTPQRAFEAIWQDGTNQVFLLATDYLYILFPGPPAQWQYIYYSGRATAAGSLALAGGTSVSVSDATALISGVPINIQLANGQVQTTDPITLSGGIASFTTPLTANVNVGGWVQPILPLPTLSSAIAPGNTSFNLTLPSGVTVDKIGIVPGARLGVTLSNGQQWQLTVNTAAGSVVTAMTPCPSPGAAIGGTVIIPFKLNGSVTIQPQMLVFPLLDKVIISNGVDPIQVYTHNGTSLAQLPGLPANTTCLAMQVFHESLHIANTKEGGVTHPGRVRMSDATDPTGWTPGQNGIAALYDLVDTNDPILSLNVLGPWLIVYRAASIIRGTYLGLPLNTVYWEYMVVGEGILGQGCVVELGVQAPHIIVGTQNIYTYAGDYNPIPIGEAVYQSLFGIRSSREVAASSLIFMVYMPENEDVLIFFPSGNSTYPNTMVRYSVKKKAWYPRTFVDSFVSASPYSANVTTWLATIGAWATDTLSWASNSTTLGATVFLFCSPTASTLFVYDYIAQQDNGKPIQWYMVMKDIGDGDVLLRWDSVTLYGQGNNITLEYALDPPNDNDPQAPPTVYTPMTDADGNALTLNFGAGVSRQRFTFNQVSSYVRLKLSGSDPTFTLSWAEMWYGFESEY